MALSKINSATQIQSNVNTIIGTSYTLQASDNNGVVYTTNSAAVTITVPASLVASFSCLIIQGGAGQVTVASDGTSVVNNAHSSLKLFGQYAVGSVIIVLNSNGSSANGVFAGDTA